MYLYLMHCPRLGLTKIGYSINPTRRRQRVHYGKLGVKMLAMYKIANAKILETDLHKRFSNLCVKDSDLPTHEWFNLDRLQLRLLMIELKRLERGVI